MVKCTYSNIISAPKISPVLGFTKLGPYPPNGARGEEVHLKTLYLISPASQSAESGCILTTIAFLKPAFSKATFHCKTASLIMGRHSLGVEFSIHQTIGFTGSENAAVGSFFLRFHL